MKRMICFLMCTCLLLSGFSLNTSVAFATNTVPEGYIGIYNAKDLDSIRQNLSGKYILMSDIDLSVYENWTPIGGQYVEEAFTGILDGNGHVITNMHIDAKTTGYDSVGLFSILDGATIIGIRGISGTISAEGVPCVYAGSVAGIVYDSSISQCASYVRITYQNGQPSGEIYTSSFGAVFNGGGITGWTNDGTEITQCANYGEIIAISKSAPISVGGIVGVDSSFSSIVIEDCYNGAELSISSGFTPIYLGGIIGSSIDVNIDRCYNAGRLLCSAGKDGYVGGIVGDTNNASSSIISNCFYDSAQESAVGCVPFLNNKDVDIDIQISATALITSDMYKQQSFGAFNFSTVWTMGSGEYPYPVLRSIGGFISEYLDSTSGGNNNPYDEETVITATNLIGKDVDVAIALLQANGYETTKFDDAVAIGEEQEVMLYYNEGSYGNYAIGMIHQIVSYGDFPITNTIRSGMTLSEVDQLASQAGYETILSEQEEYGTVYTLTITEETWTAEFIWSESYYDWNLGRNVLKENYDPNKSAADQVYVTWRNDTGATGNSGNDTHPEEERACAFDELTNVDYLAFAMLAYQIPVGDDPTVKEIIGDRWTAEWSNGITYGDLCEHIQGWKCIGGMSGTGVGFKALAFGNDQNEVIITFQGSMSLDKWKEDPDGFWADWWDNNAKMLLNGEGAQVRYAMRFYDMIVEDYAPKQIGITGHSLGGALGDIVAAYSGCGGVTFNAAPFLDIAYAYFPDRMAKGFEGVDKWKFVDSINSNDIVGMFGNSIKPRIVYSDEGLNDSAHSLESFVYKNQAGEICFISGNTFKVDRITWAMPGWSITDLKGFLTAGRYIDFGTSSSDQFFGLAGADSLYDVAYESLSGVYVRHAFGGDGSDEIIAGLWADIIVGGKGQDFLSGSYGDDTYIYTKGDGIDYIIDISGSDKLCITGFAASDQFTVEQDVGTYIVISCNGEPIIYIDRECRSHYNKFIVEVDRGDEVSEYNISSFFNPKSISAHLIIECSVDVQITDSEGNVVYILKDGEVGAHYTDYGVFYVYEEAEGGYGKVADLFEGYEARIIGNTEGTMDIAMWNVENGALSESYYYIESVEVTATMRASITESNNGVVTLAVDTNGDGTVDNNHSLSLVAGENTPSDESTRPTEGNTQPTDGTHANIPDNEDVENNSLGIWWIAIAVVCVIVISGVCVVLTTEKKKIR